MTQAQHADDAAPGSRLRAPAPRLAVCALALAALAACAPAGGATVSLVPAGEGPPVLPFHAAKLTVANDAAPDAAAVEAVVLRPRLGGPAVRLALTVPPGGTASAAVALPALEPRETYDVKLLCAGGATLDARAAIDWPLESLNAQDFLAPTLINRWADSLPQWPQSLRRNLMAVLLLGAAAMSAALFVRRRWARLAIVALAAGLTAAGASAFLSGRQVVDATFARVASDEARPAASAPATAASDERTILVLRTRRTVPWQVAGAFAPLYRSLRELRADTGTTIDWPSGVRLVLDPDDVRVLERVWP